MTIDDATRNYFNTVKQYDTVDDVKYLIESWLTVNYNKHDIELSEFIYNKRQIVDEFYNKLYGTDKTTF